MDIGKAIGYPLKDKNWIVKVIIGTIIFIIPIVDFISFGYLVRVIRQVLSDDEEKMPEWDDFGGDFVRGLMVIIGIIIYSIPIIIVSCCLSLIGGVVGGDDGNALSALVSCCLFIISLAYGVILGPLVAAAIIHYSEKEDFGAFLDFRARFDEVRNHASDAMMFVIWFILLEIIVGIVFGLTVWICGLGLVFLWGGYIAGAHLTAQYGQALRGSDLAAFATASASPSTPPDHIEPLE